MVQVRDDAVDARPDEAARDQLGEDVLMLALAVSDHRRQHHDALPIGQGQRLIDHLAHGLRIQRLAVIRAARLADASKQQPQVVVDLGDRAHRGAGVVGSGLLLDGDGGRQPLDVVHVRLLHHRQELPRIGRQRLHVAALALGVEGVEGERGLAGAGEAGHHDQLVAGDVQVDVLEVVGARAAHGDLGEARWRRCLRVAFAGAAVGLPARVGAAGAFGLGLAAASGGGSGRWGQRSLACASRLPQRDNLTPMAMGRQ